MCLHASFYISILVLLCVRLCVCLWSVSILGTFVWPCLKTDTNWYLTGAFLLVKCRLHLFSLAQGKLNIHEAEALEQLALSSNRMNTCTYWPLH